MPIAISLPFPTSFFSLFDVNQNFKFRELMKLKKLKKLKDDTLGCGLHSASYSAAKAIVL